MVLHILPRCSLLNLPSVICRFCTILPSSTHKPPPAINHQSFKPKTIHFFNLLPFCRTTNHLKSLKSLLIVCGLIQHRELLRELLKSCFHLGAVDIALATFNTIRNPSVSLQNLVIRGFSNYGLHENVLSLFLYCRNLNCPSNDFTFPFVIKACSALGAFGLGKEIHCFVLRTGYEQNVVIQTAFIDLYAKNGYLRTARVLIDRIPQPDLVSWNAFLAGYSFHGYDEEAFEVFKHVFLVGLKFKPNFSTLASVIPICTRSGCLNLGRSLHGFAVKSGFLVNDFLVPALISMYANEMHLSAARKLFGLVLEKNVAVWNAMISAYMTNSMPFEAFWIFQEMHHACVQPNSVTFVSIIPSCEIVGSIWLGESFHACVIKHGSENHTSVLTALVSMYAKLGDVNKAIFLFDGMPKRNFLSWNAMVSGYVCNGLWDASLAAFCEMQLCGFVPDVVSIISVLYACSKLEAVLLGKSAHAFSIRNGINSNLNVSNALLAFYFDCSHCASSFKLFQTMDTRDTVSWNTLISRCVHSGEKAVELLHQLQREGLALDLVTLISILPMYYGSENLGQGMTLHGYAIKHGFASDISLANALISMYCKCGDLDAGRLLFEVMLKRCVVSWNSLIGSYKCYNLHDEVLIIFKRMVKEDQRPNSVTLLNLLPICCSQLQGKSIHAFAIRVGILQEIPLLTSLIFMYARFAKVNFCHLLFKMSEKRDISLWNAILSVHIQTKNAEKAVALFCDLLRMGLQPDSITILSLISAYAQLNSLKLADSVMAYVVHKGLEKYVMINNALIDLYARCGNILAARKIFESLLEKDAVTWSVMINAYGMHGNGETALELFSEMQLSGLRPDDITFLSILSACGHAGLVEQAWMVLCSMIKQGVSPKIEHYASIVDLLGRRGDLKEAYSIVKKLPCKPSDSQLESLLGACKIHGNVELGEKISKMIFGIDPENSGSYVMLSNIYAEAGQWMDAKRARSRIEERRLRKVPGFSFLAVDLALSGFSLQHC